MQEPEPEPAPAPSQPPHDLASLAESAGASVDDLAKLSGDDLAELMRDQGVKVLARSKIAEEHKLAHEEHRMVEEFGAVAGAARAGLKLVSRAPVSAFLLFASRLRVRPAPLSMTWPT